MLHLLFIVRSYCCYCRGARIAACPQLDLIDHAESISDAMPHQGAECSRFLAQSRTQYSPPCISSHDAH